MRSKGYRLRLSLIRRALLSTLLVFIALFMIPGLLAAELSGWWRILSAAGLITAVLGLRTVLGPVIVVSDRGLRIQKNWPVRRTITWYRILAIDVIPGFWNLEVELNSGERLSLPCVEDLDELYENMERRRQALDA